MTPDEPKDETPGAAEQPPAADSNPPEKSEKDKKKPNWVIIILLVLLLLLGIVLGWIWWKDKDKTAPAASEDKTSSTPVDKPSGGGVGCVEGFTAYENESLDIKFCYPEGWGEVNVNDAKFAGADTGTRWRVSFTAKEQVNLGLVSADWSTDVPRDGVCVDPAVQTLPAFSPFSTTWDTDGTPANSATRGIQVVEGDFLITELVDNLLGNGVCLEGFKIVNGTYPHAAASYSAEFGGAVTTPDEHMANPNTLISAGDRGDFIEFVKSIHKLSS